MASLGEPATEAVFEAQLRPLGSADMPRASALGALPQPCTQAECWQLTTRYGYVYRASNATTVRLSHAKASRCLAHRHVMFIGDSIARFLYLSLAAWLASGNWPEDGSLLCYAGSPGSVTATQDPEFDRWSAFFNWSNALIGDEVCDCYTDSNWNMERRHIENRFTALTQPNGSGTVRVSYAQHIKGPTWRIHGTVSPGSASAMRSQLWCQPGLCNGSATNAPFWASSLPEFILTELPKLEVDTVVLNLGGHWWNPAKPQNWNWTASVLAAASANGARRVIWLTPTCRHKNGRAHPSSRQGFSFASARPFIDDMATRFGTTVVDLLGMTTRLNTLHGSALGEAWVGGVHFTCSVNRELLRPVLNELCARGHPGTVFSDHTSS